MVETKPKAYLFAITHALPTAMLMHEDGRVIAQHGGSDAQDAKDWLQHYLAPKLVEYNLKPEDIEIVELDQEKVEQHLYQKASIDTLGEGMKKAFENNQKLAREELAKEAKSK